MSHIDQKRVRKNILTRLKKLNIIDLLFIGAFFVFVVLFIIIFARSDQSIKVRIKVTDQNAFFLRNQPPDEYVYSFHEGDAERNEVGKVIAQIANVDRFQTNPDTYTLYLDVNIKANYNPLKKQYSYKGRPIIFGQDLEFDFSNTKVDGLIVDFPQFVKPHATPLKLKVETQLRNENRSYSDIYGMPKYFENVVNVGNVVTDSNGKEIAKVLAKKINPAKRTVVTSDGRITIIDDPDLIDIYYTLEVNAYEIEGKLYIHDYSPFQIGGTVPLIFGDISIWPTVLSYQKM